MKKLLVCAILDYVSGYLRSGHLEGEIELTDEEYERFKANPIKFLVDNDYDEGMELLVDDFRVNDYGNICHVNWEEI